MELKEAIEILELHNNWRRGIVNEMPYLPGQVGEAIDRVVNNYYDTPRNCVTCAHYSVSTNEHPCKTCHSLSNWEAR